MQRVTKANYPILYDVLDQISHDCGAQAGHTFYELPETIDLYVVNLMRLELIFQKLTPNERTEFAIGDEISRDAFGEQLGGTNACYAIEVMDAFFEQI